MKSYIKLCTIVALLVSATIFSGTARAQNQNLAVRIVGGVATDVANVPFIVSLRKNGRHYCGGTLVSSRWVLTAAHCVDGMTPDEIVAGSSQLSSSSARSFKISQVIPHPQFSQNVEMSTDVALIKLASSASFPIAWLNRTAPRFLKVSTFTVAGWGLTNENAFGVSESLQSVQVPLVSQAACEKQLQDASPSAQPYLDNSMFCAGFAKGGKDSCQGDSGGPLYYKDAISGKYMITGVVSWGFGCARPNQSGIYADVSNIYRWVLDTMYAKK